MTNGNRHSPCKQRSESEKFVSIVNLVGTEKRYSPSKHYVFILLVRWSNGREYKIYRKYSDFYDFQMNMLETFPQEGGQIHASDRIIPYLPGKRLLQRTEVHKVASKRQVGLADYCDAITQLPQHISRSSLVQQFFTALPEDLNPPENNTERPVKSGLLHAILPFLSSPKKDKGKHRRSASFGGSDAGVAGDLTVSGPVSLERYAAIADYSSDDRKHLCLSEGQLVDILEKHDNGWWFIQTEDKQGWAPASFLEPHENHEEQDDPQPLTRYEQYTARCGYQKTLSDEVTFPLGAVLDVMHKLLDGWWVVSYNGEVGYAPATFLQPISAQADSEVHLERAIKPPAQRRCTIKPRHNKRGPQQPAKDLTMYRQMSKRMDRAPKQRVKPLPAIPHDESCSESEYENGEFFHMIQSKQTKKPEGIVNLGHHFTAEVSADDVNDDGYDQAYQVIDDCGSDEESDYIDVAGGEIYVNQSARQGEESDDQDYISVISESDEVPYDNILPHKQQQKQQPARAPVARNRTLPHLNSLETPNPLHTSHTHSNPSSAQAKIQAKSSSPVTKKKEQSSGPPRTLPHMNSLETTSALHTAQPHSSPSSARAKIAKCNSPGTKKKEQPTPGVPAHKKTLPHMDSFEASSAVHTTQTHPSPSSARAKIAKSNSPVIKKKLCAKSAKSSSATHSASEDKPDSTHKGYAKKSEVPATKPRPSGTNGANTACKEKPSSSSKQTKPAIAARIALFEQK